MFEPSRRLFKKSVEYFHLYNVQYRNKARVIMLFSDIQPIRFKESSEYLWMTKNFRGYTVR